MLFLKSCFANTDGRSFKNINILISNKDTKPQISFAAKFSQQLIPSKE